MDEVVTPTRIPPASPVNKLRVRGGDTRKSSESPSGKVVPHYLQASTGSCHEFCKHGKPDEHVDSRPWRSKPVIGKLHAKESEVTMSAAIKKTVAVKPNTSVDHKIQSPSKETSSKDKSIGLEIVDVQRYQASSVIKTDATDESNTTSLGADEVKQENSTPLENAEEISLDTKCSKHPSNKPSVRSPSPIASRSSMDGRKSIDVKKAFEVRKSIDRKKTVQVKKTVDETKSKIFVSETTAKCDGNADNAEKNSEDSMSADETKTFEGRKISGSEESKTSPVKNGSKESKNSPEKKGSKESKSLNLEGHKKDGNLGKANINGKSELLKKHVAAPKPNILKMNPPPTISPITAKTPSPLHPSSAARSKTKDKNQAAEKLSTAKLESKKAGTPTSVSPTSKSSANSEEISNIKKVRLVRVVSSVRRQRIITKVVAKDTDDQGEEDAGDAVKTPPEKKSLESGKIKVSSSESLLPFSPSVSKVTVRPRISYMPSRLKSLPAESEQKTDVQQASTRGLRKSNAVDKEPENHLSTTLKARRGPLIGDTAQINRRSLKKRIGAGAGAGGTAIEKNSSDSYLLRRPSARRKKNVQVLFNKVIEETASRLVRTSKSKVLALVGAFETVISIQRKSSAGTTPPKAKKISSSTAIKAG